MTDYRQLPPTEQRELPGQPYDRWIDPAGTTLAEFHHRKDGYLIRFPDQADFAISAADYAIECTPVPDCPQEILDRTLHNAIRPVIANHTGRLSLHGSAVAVDDRAIAFLGLSRRGKTTLAGALANRGHPFLTEDWLELSRQGKGYLVVPKQPALRVFADTAAFLRPGEFGDVPPREKVELAADARLPFANTASRLTALYFLGPGENKNCVIQPKDASAALVEMIPGAFVLDSEDRERMRAHFSRLGDLAATVPAYTLDYPRSFAKLPEVVNAVVDHLETVREAY